MELLKYDVPTLQYCAKVLQRAGEDLDRQVTELLGRLPGLGDYLGSDEIGRGFKAGFGTPQRATEKHLTQAGPALSILGDLLSFSVDEIVAQDAANADRLRKAHK
jgi:hypothetical protein